MSMYGQRQADWAQCKECGCDRPKSAMERTASTDASEEGLLKEDPVIRIGYQCIDIRWCERAKRIREEVFAEFEATHSTQVEEAEIAHQLKLSARAQERNERPTSISAREREKAKRRETRPLIQATCPCGVQFESRRAFQKFCSKKCQEAAQSAKLTARRKAKRTTNTIEESEAHDGMSITNARENCCVGLVDSDTRHWYCTRKGGHAGFHLASDGRFIGARWDP